MPLRGAPAFGCRIDYPDSHEYSPDGNPFRYCGEYFDGELGTVYLRARYYDPATSRMLSEDTVRAQMRKLPNGQEIADPLSLNLYTYCANNPIMYQDASGHFFMLVTAAIGAVVGAVVGGVVAAATGNNVWAGIGIGAAAGGLIGLTGGAAAAYLATGTALASTSSVMLADASWAAALAGSGAATSAALGRTFEKWFYSFYDVAQKAQQITVNVAGKGYRLDAFINGKIYELKNYDWSKYGNLNGVISDFTKCFSEYSQITQVNGQTVKDIVFYFSSKPPQQVIDALQKLGAQVPVGSKTLNKGGRI